jgi:hypothetical protein
VIEWGTWFAGGNPDARIVRVEHRRSEKQPRAAAAAVTSRPEVIPLPLDGPDEPPGRGGSR